MLSKHDIYDIFFLIKRILNTTLNIIYKDIIQSNSRQACFNEEKILKRDHYNKTDRLGFGNLPYI